jgi:hypothetical protein
MIKVPCVLIVCYLCIVDLGLRLLLYVVAFFFFQVWPTTFMHFFSIQVTNVSKTWFPFISLGRFRAGHIRFGPVLDQNKQSNRFFLVFEPNRTENWFKPINFGSVQFFSLPNQFKPKLFQLQTKFVHSPKKIPTIFLIISISFCYCEATSSGEHNPEKQALDHHSFNISIVQA